MLSPKSNSGRYRKNVERDEEFIDVTCGLVNKVEWAVKQNMTVDIYEQYFTEQVRHKLIWSDINISSKDWATSWPECSVNTVAVYKDLVEGEGRGVSCASWALGEDRIALAYCNPDFLARYLVYCIYLCIFHGKAPNIPFKGTHHMQWLPMSTALETQAARSLSSNQVKHSTVSSGADGSMEFWREEVSLC